VGITVYGYAVPQAAPWIFQIDDEASENLTLEQKAECNTIKDRQGLENGTHRVVVTPLSRNFVLTQFRCVYSTRLCATFIHSTRVAQDRVASGIAQGSDKPLLTTGQIIGIAVGSASVLIFAFILVCLLTRKRRARRERAGVGAPDEN
jgi:hypothetical protein